jgi:hypothetical protein
MRRFENEDVASVDVPAFHLAERCERPLLSQLSPMTLTVAESEVLLRATRKFTVPLGLEQRS